MSTYYVDCHRKTAIRSSYPWHWCRSWCLQRKAPSSPQLPRDDGPVLDLNRMLLVSGTISQTVHGLCQCVDFSIICTFEMRTFFNGVVLIYTQTFVEIVVSGAPYTDKPWSFGLSALTFLSSHEACQLGVDWYLHRFEDVALADIFRA